MLVNTQKMVSISEVNQNFSKIAKLVDEDKSVVILKNNKRSCFYRWKQKNRNICNVSPTGV